MLRRKFLWHLYWDIKPLQGSRENAHYQRIHPRRRSANSRRHSRDDVYRTDTRRVAQKIRVAPLSENSAIGHQTLAVLRRKFVWHLYLAQKIRVAPLSGPLRRKFVWHLYRWEARSANVRMQESKRVIVVILCCPSTTSNRPFCRDEAVLMTRGSIYASLICHMSSRSVLHSSADQTYSRWYSAMWAPDLN